jgi:hypothetical protein
MQVSWQYITMDSATLLLGCALVAIALVFFLMSHGNSARLAAQISNIPGPPAYPIVGTTLPLLFIQRNGEC